MLEIIIIFIVVATFAGVVWYAMHRSRRNKRNKLTQQMIRVEPELSKDNVFSSVLQQQMTQHTIDTTIDDEPNISLSDQVKQTTYSAPENKAQQSEIHFKANDDIDVNIELAEDDMPAIDIVNEWDMVIAFTIMAGEGQQFSGADIKFALESEQFHYGEMNLFHRFIQQKKPLFSVANVLAPGTFGLDKLNMMATPGILVFAKLPGPINGLSLFDDLLKTSQSLTTKLSGILCDETRKPVNEDTIEAMRSRILNLNFSMHSESQN